MTTTKLIDRWHTLMQEGRGRDLEMWFEPAPAASKKEILATEQSLGKPLPPLLAELLLCSRAWGWRDMDYDVQFLEPDAIVRD